VLLTEETTPKYGSSLHPAGRPTTLPQTLSGGARMIASIAKERQKLRHGFCPATDTCFGAALRMRRLHLRSSREEPHV
jgi:hypothetical protein